LLIAAHAEGSLVSSIKNVLVPVQRPPSAQGHTFAENTEPPIDAVAA